MQRFAMTVTSKGQVTLPAEYRRSIGALPGDRLSLVMNDDGHAVLTKDTDDLSAMQRIARGARPNDAAVATGTDSIGDYLVAEDERTKTRR